MPNCFIGLGGNDGRVADTLHRSLHEIDLLPGISVLQVSHFLKTAPVGENVGGGFLNAAAELQCDLEPLDLLDRLQKMEDSFGRVRDIHWGPRTLDLDLLLYGDEIIDHPRLSVPHPALWYRRFVLDPLAEIAADIVHPEKRFTIAELKYRLLTRPLTVACAGGSEKHRQELLELQLATELEVEITLWNPDDEPVESRLPTIIAWLGSGADEVEFDSLPSLPRLDISQVGTDPRDALKAVVQSALGR